MFIKRFHTWIFSIFGLKMSVRKDFLNCKFAKAHASGETWAWAELAESFTPQSGVSMVAWTTTPWTLPSNLALCVNPDKDYVKVRETPESAITASLTV